ncbi:Bromodomain adjacent to zinc finger domain protein 1A, partial [Caligus rogercresseyi]
MGRLSDLVDDVYKFSQGRYFLGEKIEAVIGNMWCESIVKEVIPPTPEEIEEFNRNNAMDEKAKKKNSFEPHESLFKYKVLETDPDDPANNP